MNFLAIFSLIGASWAFSLGNTGVYMPRAAVPLAEVFPSVAKFYGPHAWANRLGRQEYAHLDDAEVISHFGGSYGLPVAHHAYFQPTQVKVAPYTADLLEYPIPFIAGQEYLNAPYARHAYAKIPAALRTAPWMYKYFSNLFNPRTAYVNTESWPFGINKLINGGFHANRYNTGLPFVLRNKANIVADIDAVFTERDAAGQVQGLGRAHGTMIKNTAGPHGTHSIARLADLTNAASYVKGFPVRDAARYSVADGVHSNIFPAGSPIVTPAEQAMMERIVV